jgi:sulfate adenylyltransferase subunit 1
VNSLVFAVNKLDAVEDPALAFAHISAALQKFTASADIKITATVPVSALKGYNVVNSTDGWAGYHGPSLLQLLEQLPNTPTDSDLALAFPCSGWRSSLLRPTPARAAACSGAGRHGRGPRSAQAQILPSGQLATVAQVIDHARAPKEVAAGLSAGITLDREVDVSRGDWIIAAPVQAEVAEDDFDAPAAASPWPSSREITATVAWMDTEPWCPVAFTGRCMATAGSRPRRAAWCTASISIHWTRKTPKQLEANAIGQVELVLQEAIPAAPSPSPPAGLADSGGHCQQCNSRCRAGELKPMKTRPQPRSGAKPDLHTALSSQAPAARKNLKSRVLPIPTQEEDSQ